MRENNILVTLVIIKVNLHFKRRQIRVIELSVSTFDVLSRRKDS